MAQLKVDLNPMRFAQVATFAFRTDPTLSVRLDADTLAEAQKSYQRLHQLIEKRLPIYGVTTGFGDSCFRFVDPHQSEELQKNLISYLVCGSGPSLSCEAVRAAFLIRLKSLSRGFSGVSPELLQRMALYLERDWIPIVPQEGSLGASGDLIPLAYLAQALQGRGRVLVNGRHRDMAEVLMEAGIEPYTLKAKEGLALVNGTSAMAGLAMVNWVHVSELKNLCEILSAWTCLALGGRTEPFRPLVNEWASLHHGQAKVAKRILSLLEHESYQTKSLSEIGLKNSMTTDFVQDRYSLRCSPQILGPVQDTLSLTHSWIEEEINGTTDNPLLGQDSELYMGGNFYGGYLAHAMDYLKICLGQMADLMDRQLMTVIDEKSNRGLPPNLAGWNSIPKDERFLHHGLKGLHQAVSALTSEILANAMPNGLFSRSSESHNQDKVSLGMSAATRCHLMIEQSYTVMTMSLICLAQALDLRGRSLRGDTSLALYDRIRRHVPFIERDQALDQAVQELRKDIKLQAARGVEAL